VFGLNTVGEVSSAGKMLLFVALASIVAVAALNSWSVAPSLRPQEHGRKAALLRKRTVPAAILDASEPIAPAEELEERPRDSYDFLKEVRPMAPDILKSPNSTFPWNEALTADDDEIDVPMDHRKLQAYGDRLRRGDPIQQVVNPKEPYPLVAPGDELGLIAELPEAVMSQEALSSSYAGVVSEVAAGTTMKKKEERFLKAFAKIDVDMDGSISQEEFKAVLEKKQGKPPEQAQYLWDKYHKSDGNFMSKTEFRNVWKNGYDLGQDFIDLDVERVLTSTAGTPLGYWGAGVACPTGSFANGARLKISSPHDGDLTALNAVGLRCEDGTELSTVEGPDGSWTEWAECPTNQYIHAFKLRNMIYKISMDNSAVNDMIFLCEDQVTGNTTELRFGVADTGESGVVVAAFNGGKMPTDGGWGLEKTCGALDQGSAGFVCGAQARLRTDTGGSDDMGITDLRVFCCLTPVDCTNTCQDGSVVKPNAGASAKSTACLECLNSGGYERPAPAVVEASADERPATGPAPGPAPAPAR